MTTPQMYGWYQEKDGDWQDYANCMGVDPDLYFPDRASAEESYAQTRPICAQCVVRDECKEYAITNNMTSGMWGGMTSNDLKKERKRRLKVRKQEAEEGQDNG